MLPQWTFPPILLPAVYQHFFHLCLSQHPTHAPLSAAKLTWINFSIKISWDNVKCFTKIQISLNSHTEISSGFILFDFFFFPPSLCLKLIIHTKTSTTLPCLDHFQIVFVKDRLEVSVCPKPSSGFAEHENASLSFSLQWLGWAGPGFLPKSSLRFPVLSIILIHTARKQLLSIPYHTRSSRWSCNSTQWFLCQWEKSFSSSSHHLVSVVCPNCQTQAPEIQETLPQRVQRSEFIQSHFWTLILYFLLFSEVLIMQWSAACC